MKKRRLKSYVLPTTYLLITITIFTGILFMSNKSGALEEYNFSTGVMKEEVKPVVETENNDRIISSPVDLESVKISVYYYSKDDETTRQEQSLILYEDTYLPNSGILLTSDNVFEVKSVYDGKVLEVKDDEILGTYVVIEHNANLKTYYYGIDNIEVKQNDEVKEGTILGTSKENNISKGNKSCLFEAYYKGQTINPEKLINANIQDYE